MLEMAANRHGKPMRRQMSDMGKATLLTQKPTNQSIPCGIVFLRTALTHDQLVAWLDERLLCNPNFFRFRCTASLTEKGAGHFEEITVDLNKHIHHHILRSPATVPILQEEISKLAHIAFNPALPLWDMHAFDNYQGPEGTQALFWRFHHCIADGPSMASVFLALSDNKDDLKNEMLSSIESRLTQRSTRPHNLFIRLLLRILLFLWTLWGILRVIAKWARMTVSPRDPVTTFKSRQPLGVEKRLAWTESFDPEEVKRVGKLAGNATFNDVIMTCIAEGMRQYMLRHPPPGRQLLPKQLAKLEVRLGIPVNVRTPQEMAEIVLGNKFGFVFVRWPLGQLSPLARLQRIKRQMDTCKSTPEPVMAYWMSSLTAVLPVRFVKYYFDVMGSKLTAVFSNVRGPETHFIFAERTATKIIGFVPPPNGVGLGLGVFSYANSAHISIWADATLIRDPTELAKDFSHAFEELKRAVHESKLKQK